MALLDQENGVNRRAKNMRGPTPQYAKMPRGGRMIIDPARLRYYRNLSLMSREQLAEASRLSVDSIRSYERGRRFPREAAFRRLFTALGIGPESLLFDDCRYIRTTKKEKNGDQG